MFYHTSSKLRERCDGYFRKCDETESLYGEAGLALYLDVPLETLRGWWSGQGKPGICREARRAYLRIQDQLETSPLYRNKTGMASWAAQRLRDPHFGGAGEQNQDLPTFRIVMDTSVDRSDLE